MIALYQGTGLLSWWIKTRTWSKYSHASWILSDGTEIEAWGSHGICHNKIFGCFHAQGTKVDLFDFKTVLTREENMKAEAFLLAQVGKKYDYIGLFRFLPIVRWFVDSNDNSDKWFCSELCSETCNVAGRPVINKPSFMVEPAELATSEELKYIATRIV